MTDYKLTYFDMNAGRGEPLRIAMHIANIQFEDVRWTFSEFSANRNSLRFNAVPTLEIDGAAFTQSNALSRYIGKMADLYPSDPVQALYCDEVLEALEDLSHHLVQTFGLEGDEFKAAREKFTDTRLTTFTKGFEELLSRGGGNYFSDNRLTIADLKMMVTIRSFRSGNLDHVPVDFIDNFTPSLVDFQNRIEQLPQVVAYYASIKQP
ncbi:MAG: glutathione S-transferase [Gammaproteobacteria bacterium]|nr:glutathione S-transferase [Gammaproteobacteria bacterium]